MANFTCGIYLSNFGFSLIFITKEGIIKGVIVDCQDTVKYSILGYFLNTKYWDEKCHTAQHYATLVESGSSI